VTAEDPRPISVGVVAGGSADRIRALEALPIDSLWVGGHVASRNPSPEAMVGLARLAALTERVQIGTSILLLPLYPPAIVAKQIADLDNATGGRVILGVGVGGEYPGEFRACQVPSSERGPRTNEAIPLLRKLWTAETISHEGRFYAMQDVKIHPAPVQPGGPPIVVAGRQEAAMRRAATMGDGWMPYLYSPRRYAASVQTIREVAEEAGRDLDGFGWHAFVFVNVGVDGDRAREEAAQGMGGNYNQDFRPMVDSVAAAGTADEVTEKLAAFVDAGARSFLFTPMTTPDATDAMVRELVTEVMHRVQAYASS
jgi:probable F420-dependent oxidoreductase